VTLLQLEATEFVLLLNLHHIVADGWSIGVLIRELSLLYTTLSHPSLAVAPLPELPIQYADFAEWQREWLEAVGTDGCSPLETQLAYWRQQLHNISVLNLPCDRSRLAIPTYQGATQLFTLPQNLSLALQVLSDQESTTLFMTLLAAFQTLLYRYTGQTDIAVGSPIANRNRSEIEGIIGFFVNSLVLRTDLSGNPTFLELLSRVKKVTLGAYAHQDLPFEKLVEELHPQRDLSRNPLFQVSFALQNTPVAALELPELTLSLLEFDSGTAKLDLEFHLWQEGENLKGQVVYSTDLFDDATITRMLGHFQTLLEGIVANPQQRLYELPLLTAAERQQLIGEFNQSLPARIGQCFHQRFEQQVAETPNAIALSFENKTLTYQELNSRANQLAHYLQKLEVVPDAVVGICVERSLEMIVGVLGILKAGAAYLPLDPAYPQERLRFMLEDTQLSILLTQQSFVERFLHPELSLICLDQDWQKIALESQQNPNSHTTPHHLAYISYTSGSTGIPKGVQIQHRGLSNLIQAQIEVFSLQPHHRVLQFASLSFDASIFEIVMALATGASLYLAKKASLLPGEPLNQLLRQQAITHVTLPPAVLAVLPSENLPALETIISAGETCSQEIVKRWAKNRRFFNAYGPTEATVWSTVAEIKDVSGHPVIGQAIANTQVYLLDSHLQPVPIGIPGELYIGGEGLARGYLNRPELTAEKFIPHPFGDLAQRLYKTGDLARYRPDGNLEFLGRLDEQVKIRGFRIELGEIESFLHQHPAIREAVVVATEDTSQNQQLVAYVVPHPELTPTIFELRNFLKAKLPEYMIPSVFVFLDSLPLTPNGKVDRRLLPAPSNAINPTFVAPRTVTESKLAAIWAEVLNREPVGIHDNFFEIGGDSLLAVRLVEKIHQQLQPLPLSTLFLHPTIAGLANTLEPKTETLSWSPLVAIQPTGSKPPFFCVHPIFGVVFPYYELARHLGTDKPFYGLQSLGLDSQHPPLTSLEDIASHYIQALRVVQPKSPYFLGGWSFGGLVAFEMAQQLLKSGEEVAFLGLLDTQAPISPNQPSFCDSLKFLLTTVSRYIWPFFFDYLSLLTATDKPQIESTPKHSWHSLLGQAAIANFLPQESKQRILSELTIRPILRVFQANSQATLSYVPQVYPGKLTLFRTRQQPNSHPDSTLGWSDLTNSDVDVHLVPGNHLNMLRKPHVQILSEQINQAIAKIINTN
jgi:amino acid adenylation domain-containing protein